MKHVFLLIGSLLLAMNSLGQSLRNPVIPGYHPDPSVCRVGDTFYLVNSSFQYYPGVPLFSSKDLVNWQQVGNVLTRTSQLNLRDASSWTGIYAPTLRYHKGVYYMITTNVGHGGNFLVTATKPEGPWSDPIWLEQQGIDPSLWFEDGKCYMMSNPDNTIMLCEIDPKTGRQLTPSRPIWQGDGGRYPEGPHLYKKDGYYYLLISEGGTELAHRLTIARSHNIYGPYQSNPGNPILTNCSMKGQDKQIQGTGHGDLVEAADGSWWLVFLAYRNYGGSYHHLGRETCLAPVEWKRGQWPIVNDGQPIDTLMAVNTLPTVTTCRHPNAGTFAPTTGDAEWIHLQNPITANYEWLGETCAEASVRPSQTQALRLTPHGTLSRNDQPTFVGRRQECARFTAETEVALAGGGQEGIKDDMAAGLTVYQIHDGHVDLVVTNRQIAVRCKLKSIDYTMKAVELFPQSSIRTADGQLDLRFVRLRIDSDGDAYRFYYSLDGKVFTSLGSINCSLMSTEVAGGFTGVTIGMMAEGNNATSGTALFKRFLYEEK